jgi:hypothetical protein
MAPSKKTPAPKPAPKAPTSVPPTARGFTQYRLVLSKAHARILDSEAEFTRIRRSQFLENLLRAESGEGFLRRPEAPRYEFPQNDLVETAPPWAWYVPDHLKDTLRDAMARFGFRDPTAWATWALNRWIGKPEGFKKEKDGRYR